MFKNLLDDFFDILFNPAKGLGRVAKHRGIWQGLAVYLVVSIVVSWATLNADSFAAFPWVPHELVPYLSLNILEKTQLFFPLLTFFIQLFFWPLYFFLMVAIQNFVTGLFDGEGEVTSLGAVLGYSHLPLLIIAVGGLLGRYTAFNILGLVGLIAFLWSIALKIAGIKLVHGFSWGRASLAFFMPLIALVTSFILFILLSIVFLFPMLMQALEGFPGYTPF
jgi:hypothetical protein